MRTLSLPHRIALTCGLLLLGLSQAARAIEIDRPFLAESWTLAPGSVFEMLAIPSTDLQYAWSLTRADGTFVQADRGPLLRERFVESGDYALKVEATTAALAPFTNRTFIIHISPGAPPAATGSTLGPLVMTDVSADGNGVIVLSEERKTLLFTGVPGSSQLSLDFDASKDANGDGDPTNDNDSRGTFFESDGSPLTVWFTDAPADRTITVRGVTGAGPQTQTLRIASFSTPPPSSATPPLLAPAGLEVIQIEDRGNGTFAFSVKEGAVSAEGRALLFLWDFGDGRQSMLDRPVHTYAANGQYVVILRARDLTTTQEVLAVTGTLPVNTIVAPVSSAASSSSASFQQSSASSQSSFGAQPASSGMWKLIITIAVVLLLAVLVGFGIVALLGRVVQRKLNGAPIPPSPKTPEKKPSPVPSLDQAPPMPVIDVAPVAGTPSKSATKPSTKSTLEPSKIETLSFREEEAPSWLRQGHEEAKKRGLSVTSAAPQPAAPSPAPSPSVSPTEPEPPAEPEERTLPPWLTEVPPEEEAPAPAPAEPRAVPAPAPSESSPPPPPSTPPPPSPPPLSTTPTPEPSRPTPIKPSVTPPAPPPKPAEQTPQPKAPAPVVPSMKETEPPADEESEEEEKGELTPAERERRRKKRARYRANKRRREEQLASPPAAGAEGAAKGSTPQEKQPSVEIKPQPSEVTPEPPAPKQKVQSPAPAPSAPAPTPEEKDAPIAIIRAENLGKEQKNPKKS